MYDWKPTSALSDKDGGILELNNGRVRLQGVDHLAKSKIHFRMLPNAVLEQKAVDKLGLPLSQGRSPQINTEVAMFWLSPNEWLFVLPRQATAELRIKLADIAGNSLFSITDLSDQFEVIEMSGKGTLDLLAEGCSVGIRTDNCKVGEYWNTRLGRFPVLLHKFNDSPAFGIYIDRSLSLQLWQWLAEGAAYV